MECASKRSWRRFMSTTNETYIQAIRDCVSCGDEVAPRGHKSYEVLQHTMSFDMTQPVITIPERELDYQFMVAEAHWILSGDDKLNDFIRKNLLKYSDDGVTMYGAYGVPFIHQVNHVIGSIVKDCYTRQAVITLWHRNPINSKDIPCTVAMQFMYRMGKLHCNAFMRSQDVWLGLPYDLFSFSMMSAWIVIRLSEVGVPCTLGTLNITAGSRHLYDKHLEQSQDLCAGWNDGENKVIYNHMFIQPDTLMNVLGGLRHYPNDQLLLKMGEVL